MVAMCQLLDNRVRANVTEAYDISGRSIVDNNKDKVAGYPFAHEAWGTGRIVLKKGLTLTNFEVQYNLYTNQLWYKIGTEVMALMDTLLTADLSFTNGKNPVPIRLRSNYPAIEKLGRTTLYEVIEEGSVVHLLRHRYKTIVDGFTYQSQLKYRYKEEEQWYLYDLAEDMLFKIPARLNWRQLPININRLINQYSFSHPDPRKPEDWVAMARWLNELPR